MTHMNAASFARSRVRPLESLSADEWFGALDQRRIGTGADSWVAQVLGVHSEREGLWVQLAPDDDAGATIVVHLSSSTQLAEVLAALERSGSSERRPEVIDLSDETVLDRLDPREAV